jgi:hypothetical protein
MASSTPTNNFHSQTARKNITVTTDNTTDSQTDRLDRHLFFSCFTEEQQQQQQKSLLPTHHTHSWRVPKTRQENELQYNPKEEELEQPALWTQQ